jgi:hypothetical protein
MRRASKGVMLMAFGCFSLAVRWPAVRVRAPRPDSIAVTIVPLTADD